MRSQRSPIGLRPRSRSSRRARAACAPVTCGARRSADDSANVIRNGVDVSSEGQSPIDHLPHPFILTVAPPCQRRSTPVIGKKSFERNLKDFSDTAEQEAVNAPK